MIVSPETQQAITIMLTTDPSRESIISKNRQNTSDQYYLSELKKQHGEDKAKQFWLTSDFWSNKPPIHKDSRNCTRIRQELIKLNLVDTHIFKTDNRGRTLKKPLTAVRLKTDAISLQNLQNLINVLRTQLFYADDKTTNTYAKRIRKCS